MRLRLTTPSETVFDGSIEKIVTEAQDGHFCLLPRHVDFVAMLVSGILVVHRKDDRQDLYGIDEGVLVKKGDDVLASVRDTVRANTLRLFEDQDSRAVLSSK